MFVCHWIYIQFEIIAVAAFSIILIMWKKLLKKISTSESMLSVRRDHLKVQSSDTLHSSYSKKDQNLICLFLLKRSEWRDEGNFIFINCKQNIFFWDKQNNVNNTADSFRFDSICERKHFPGENFLVQHILTSQAMKIGQNTKFHFLFQWQSTWNNHIHLMSYDFSDSDTIHTTDIFVYHTSIRKRSQFTRSCHLDELVFFSFLYTFRASQWTWIACEWFYYSLLSLHRYHGPNEWRQKISKAMKQNESNSKFNIYIFFLLLFFRCWFNERPTGRVIKTSTMSYKKYVIKFVKRT